MAGGARAWVDGQLIIDDWTAGPSRALTGRTPSLAAGEHDLRVEYVKTVGEGAIRLGWAPVQTPVTLPTAVITAAATPRSTSPSRWTARPRRARGRAHQLCLGLGRRQRFGGPDRAVRLHRARRLHRLPHRDRRVRPRQLGARPRSSSTRNQTPVPDQPPAPVIVAPAVGIVGEPIFFDGPVPRPPIPS
ncbi:MAG: PA14 domain-containing protein [Caldilineaceae bacterium]